MTEYTFRFYKNDKHITTKTLHTETIEEAYSMADDILRKNKSFDDWQCFPPKTNKPPQAPK